jgi:hypothetical protein
MSFSACRARLECAAIRVKSLVVRVYTQCLVVPTAVPVSSAWTTGSFFVGGPGAKRGTG